MIKNLKIKFLICLFLLVTVFSVTSSCFANSYGDEVVESPYSIEDLISSSAYKSYCSSYDISEIKYVSFYSTSLDYYLTYVICGNVNLKQKSSGANYFMFNLINDSNSTVNVVNYGFKYKNGAFTVTTINSNGSNSIDLTTSGGYPFTDLCNLVVYDSKGSVWHDFSTIDTSFSYEFEGVSKDIVRLSINDLDSSLTFYASFNKGYLYSVGDSLDYANDLNISKIHSDEKGLYYSLSPGDYINYYICNSDGKVLSVGLIDELSKGYFLYGYETGNYVNFIFLKDGVRYWLDNLDFYYSTDNSKFFNYNSIMTHHSYIDKNLLLSSQTFYAKVVDDTGNILSTAKYTYFNNLYEVDFDYVSTYYEYSALAAFGSPVMGTAGVVNFSHFYLRGYNFDGSILDFSDYYIKWTVSGNANILGIKHDEDIIVSRSGVISSNSDGSISYNLAFHFDESSYKAFDIKFDVYDPNNNLVSSNVVSSNTVIKNQVDFNEDSVNNDGFEVEENPNYSDSSNNFNNIQDWTVEDYKDLMSTDNFVWEFFKAILGNLPWWITVPLTILIFGVVIITLVRFARGA